MSGTSQTRKRKRAQRWGHWSEWIAAISLVLKGYRIVAMRYKTKVGEIDIIARKGDLAIMVEVKARKSVQAAVDSVTATAQRRINNAADLWHSKQPDATRLSIRFDIVAVRSWHWPVHFKDAF